jgi:hypothetical protein
MDITYKLIGLKSECKRFKMLAFQSDYTNQNINDKIAKFEKDISSIESEIKVESIGNAISNLELIKELFTNFFNMVFNELDNILSYVNDKKSSNPELIFEKIGKYINKIKSLFDDRTFYTQDVEKVLELMGEMNMSYKMDNNSPKGFDKKMISKILKETFRIFVSNKLYLDNIMCEFYDSGRNIDKTIRAIYSMILKMEENMTHNKKILSS